MLWHFSIHPAGDFADTRRRVLERVTRDELIVIYRRGELETLVFCPNPAAAQLQRERIAAGERLSPSLASVYLLAVRGTLRFDLECSPDSRARAAEFGTWLLAAFPGCRVVEDETRTDVTDRAIADPAWLFG